MLKLKWSSSIYVHSALAGMDECMSAMDVPRRMQALPRRQLPISSMIESDGQEFRWQDQVTVY